MTRVLHAGNVANNAYLNAKFQRRAGIEADALCDELHILSLPEWEDAGLVGVYDDYAPLETIAAEHGWSRPPWVLAPDPRQARPRFKGQHLLQARLRAYALDRLRRRGVERMLRADYAPLREVLGHDLGRLDLGRAGVSLFMFGLPWGGAEQLFRRYDVVQAYATYPIYPYLAAPDRPYVAFEHGTLREIPFEDSWRGRLMSVAYRRAAKVVITNPDVKAQADLLGLDNYVFIPHPVDEEKYTPGPSGFRDRLQAREASPLLFSPSRHDWDIKANDAMLRGFAAFVHAAGSQALLVLSEWGGEVERSRALIRELAVERNVEWLRPLTKVELIDAYRGTDIVLDQFLIGTFGAVAPEAMACGRPVVMAFDDEMHSWCFDELPPVIRARAPDEIERALTELGHDRAKREELGARSRSWIQRHHGWRLVVERHRAVYDEILGL